MRYGNFYEMEREGRAAYQLGDTNCVDCGQTICACESLADWHRERDNNFPVPVLAEPLADPSDCGDEGEARESTTGCVSTDGYSRGGENLQQPTSFSQWLEQNGDSICK
jgi:hypothetical protein